MRCVGVGSCPPWWGPRPCTAVLTVQLVYCPKPAVLVYCPKPAVLVYCPKPTVLVYCPKPAVLVYCPKPAVLAVVCVSCNADPEALNPWSYLGVIMATSSTLKP